MEYAVAIDKSREIHLEFEESLFIILAILKFLTDGKIKNDDFRWKIYSLILCIILGAFFIELIYQIWQSNHLCRLNQIEYLLNKQTYQKVITGNITHIYSPRFAVSYEFFDYRKMFGNIILTINMWVFYYFVSFILFTGLYFYEDYLEKKKIVISLFFNN